MDANIKVSILSFRLTCSDFKEFNLIDSTNEIREAPQPSQVSFRKAFLASLKITKRNSRNYWI
ncbi:hypothetical protein M1146_07660 [Patescibacteria group bacterium]|nr:hypothetical protein [Patescibacteria group bacterium]